MSFFVPYTIIQSITSSEMCSLHLTHTSAHTPGAVGTHTHTWSSGQSGEQSGVRCLAQGSHLSRGQFLPETRFEPTTSGYKSDALSIRATTVWLMKCFGWEYGKIHRRAKRKLTTHRQRRQSRVLLIWNKVSGCLAFILCHFQRNSNNKYCFVALQCVVTDHCIASVQTCELIIFSYLLKAWNEHE